MKSYLRKYWPLLPALAAFFWLCYKLNVTQDDAYISYRYVANYLNGHGLVYNIGERIEGITNFAWTMFEVFLGTLGLNFIWLSKFVGFLMGCGTVVLTYFLARLVFAKEDHLFTAAATFLVGMNQSLAHWSPAGLETAAFAFLASLALYFYLKRNWLLIFTLILAVGVRPEGAVLTAILILIELIQDRRFPKFTFICAAVAFVMSLPFVGFKIAYYGSILPNPFYAKTSFDLSQLSNGVEYVWRFMGHYGFYGLGLLVPLLVFDKLNKTARAIWLYYVMYVAYILFIGGDVLKVHRFFLPLFGANAILVLLSIWYPVRHMKPARRTLVLAVAVIPLVILSWTLPRAWVEKYNVGERAFVAKMKYKAERLLESDSTNFSVAVSTIGIFGYELLGHDIIDMVGLTDSTIAKYSEDPIPGMSTTWKEQKHNTRYLLTRAPDYIMFSTGIKPSAPAERALLLYRQFMDSYRTVGWFLPHPNYPEQGVISIAFKKRHPIVGDIVPVYPVEYVQEYKKGLDAHTVADHKTALYHYNLAMKASPRPYYVYLIYQRAFSQMMLRQTREAFTAMNALLERDSTIFEPHMDLYRFAVAMGDSTKAATHERWLKKLVPWYWPRIHERTMKMVQQMHR